MIKVLKHWLTCECWNVPDIDQISGWYSALNISQFFPFLTAGGWVLNTVEERLCSKEWCRWNAMGGWIERWSWLKLVIIKLVIPCTLRLPLKTDDWHIEYHLYHLLDDDGISEKEIEKLFVCIVFWTDINCLYTWLFVWKLKQKCWF